MATAFGNATTDALDAGAGKGQGSQGITLGTFVASLVGAILVFALEFGVFLVI